MKITNEQLKQIIKEELENVMSEMLGGAKFDAGPEWADDGSADRASRAESERVWLDWLAKNYPDHKEHGASDEMVARFGQEHPEHAKYLSSFNSEEPLGYKEDPFA